MTVPLGCSALRAVKLLDLSWLRMTAFGGSGVVFLGSERLCGFMAPEPARRRRIETQDKTSSLRFQDPHKVSFSLTCSCEVKHQGVPSSPSLSPKLSRNTLKSTSKRLQAQFQTRVPRIRPYYSSKLNSESDCIIAPNKQRIPSGTPFDSMSASKRVLIIGGSGRTGKLVIDELLTRGHQVTALVRKPESLETNSNLKTVTGTPMQISDVRNAFAASNPEVVVVTLSAPRAGDSPFAAIISPSRLMADSNANVVAVMKEYNTPKVVIMQAFGVAESWLNLQWILRLLMKKSNMIYQYDDHNLVAKEVKASGENYVFVRPSRLEEGEAKPIKEWANDGKGVPMMAACTRGSVARFMAEAVENKTWDNTAPVITN
jgi:hypothetical protein